MLIKLTKKLIKMSKIAEGVEELAASDIAGGNINWYKTFWKEFGKNVLRTINQFVSCDPEIPLLEIYAKGLTQNKGKAVHIQRCLSLQN